MRLWIIDYTDDGEYQWFLTVADSEEQARAQWLAEQRSLQEFDTDALPDWVWIDEVFEIYTVDGYDITVSK